MGVFGDSPILRPSAPRSDEIDGVLLSRGETPGTVALAAKYPDLIQVVMGTTLGMLIADIPAVILGEKAAPKLPLKLIRIVAATIFAVLGVLVLMGVSFG